MRALDFARRIPGFSLAKRAYRPVRNSVRRSAWFSRRLISSYLAHHTPAKLHIGCLEHPLRGWLNTEYGWGPPHGALYLDATGPFPIDSNSFDYIFSEHMIEHVSLAGALNMLTECHRVLKPGGRIRISTPPLEFLLDLMTKPGEDHIRYADYHYAEFLCDAPLKLPAAIVNDYYRAWGHQFVYDRQSLTQLLLKAGFVNIEEFRINVSGDPHLQGLENEGRMPDGLLALTTMTLEAERPSEATPETVDSDGSAAEWK
jgi:predicted SAM-dependent methyltransferase